MGCLFASGPETTKVYVLHLVVISHTKISQFYNYEHLFLAQVTWQLNWAWPDSAPCVSSSWSPGCRRSCCLGTLFSGWPRRESRPCKHIEGFCVDLMDVTSTHISMTRASPWWSPNYGGPKPMSIGFFCFAESRGKEVSTRNVSVAFWRSYVWPSKWRHHRTKGESILIHSHW